MSRVKDGGSWEGYFLPSPSSRGDHTLLRRTQGRVVRARESTADNRLPFTALTATSCFASQPNPLLFFSSQQKDFSKFLPCEHAPCLSTLFSVLSLHFSHISLFLHLWLPSFALTYVSFIFLSLVSSPCTTPLTGMGLSSLMYHTPTAASNSPLPVLFLSSLSDSTIHREMFVGRM